MNEENVAIGCFAGGCLLYALYVLAIIAVVVGAAVLIWQHVL